MIARVSSSFIYVLLLFLALTVLAGAKTQNTQKNAVLEDVADYKDFKKLIRTKTNVLVLFTASAKNIQVELKAFRDAAFEVRGTGTMVLIDCGASPERTKLCKKLKVNPEPYTLKHYKDGDFHKNYERQIATASLVNFMRDPSGDFWEEDETATDVFHFDYATMMKHLRKDLRPIMIMFYVPWCGFCKRLKPQYAKAATELKPENYLLGAIDVERQENAIARRLFNLTGFPTLLYFEKGKLKQAYDGETNKEAIIAFMRDPKSVAQKVKPKEIDWSADANSEVVHLTTQGFEPAIEDEKSVLIMFYAPWCGHCKNLKPEYEKAAAIMKERKIPGMLAAIDATKESEIGERFKVKGYPTLKYFVHGTYKYDVNLRDAEKIIEFMREPKEPPPPPPPQKSWEEEGETEVQFLNDQNFNTTLKRKKYALIMFYAPWCGHCKSTKPEFAAAAETLKEDTRILFGAVDCTRQTNICAAHEVRGYPTIIYFSYLKTKIPYNGGRKRNDFVDYMSNLLNSLTKEDDSKRHEEF